MHGYGNIERDKDSECELPERHLPPRNQLNYGLLISHVATLAYVSWQSHKKYRPNPYAIKSDIIYTPT